MLFQHFAKLIAGHFYAGFYGVDLFFVISGFVVTTVLLKPTERSFKEDYIRFLGRRALRIFPIYYVTIFIFWLAGHTVVRENLVYLLTYTFNYARVYYDLPKSAVNPFWSLCVEEQFYLLWPFGVLLLKNKKKALLILTGLMIGIGYAQQVFHIFPSMVPYNYVSLLTRMAPLGLGALGAIAANKNVLPGKIFTNRFVEYGMGIVLVTSLLTDYTGRLPVLGLCSLYLVIKAAFYDFSVRPLGQFLGNKKVMYIGIISYGIYVFHMPVLYFLTTYLVDPFWKNIPFENMGRCQQLQWHSWIIKLPLYSAVTILVASLSYKYIEMPLLTLKERYFQ